MGELLRRFRYPLTYLFLGMLCLVSVASHRATGAPARDRPFGTASKLVMGMAVPLQQLVTLPVRRVRGVWSEYLALVDVREENSRLREQNARLSEENLQYREAIVSSERFQRLSGFRARRSLPMVPATVVAHDLSHWFQAVIVDQGETAGIKPGMPVITDSGVVGVVAGTTPRAAKVLLVIDPQSRVDAYVQRTRARGTLRGRSEDSCDFEYVLREEELAPGDLLLTSGLGAVYPKGLVVGRVESAERRAYGLFQSVTVKPAVDFRRLEEVFVILEHGELPESDEFVEDDPRLWPGPR